MKISKCKNGHFVDSDKYSACPICNAEVSSSTSDGKVLRRSTGSNSTVSVYSKEHRDTNSFIRSNVEKESQLIVEPGPDSLAESGGIPEIKPDNLIETTSDNSPTLAQQIMQNSNSNAGKTVGFFQASDGGPGISSSINKESVKSDLLNAESSRLNARDYVAGILLCVNGPHFHECFAVCYGRNSIGRLECNDIVLNKDNSVSREKQGWINYDAKSGLFSVQPGESSKFIYVDEQAVMEPVPIISGAKLEVGDSIFIFVPFCNEKFKWENYKS